MIEIIPAIDIIGGRCVRLSQGDYDRCTTYDAQPVDMVKRYVDAGFGRVHVVDLDGAKASYPRNLATLERMASVDGASIEWGGGIKSEDALRDLFNAGATYAIIGSLAAKNPSLMGEWIKTYGSDKMVLGADVREGKIAVSGWLEDTELTISDLVAKLEPYRLTQAICTEISRDGMFTGAAVGLYEELMAQHPSVIFTASGGIGSMDDIVALDEAGVPRVIVGKALYEGRIALEDMSRYAYPSQHA